MVRKFASVVSITFMALLLLGAAVVWARDPAAGAAGSAVAQAGYTTIITVTTTADPDDDQQYVCYTEGLVGKTTRTPCTLRQALEESHTLPPSAQPILIRFELPAAESYDGSGTDYWVIQLAETGQLNALPDVGDQTTLDATTQDGGPVSYTHLTLPTKRIV